MEKKLIQEISQIKKMMGISLINEHKIESIFQTLLDVSERGVKYLGKHFNDIELKKIIERSTKGQANFEDVSVLKELDRVLKQSGKKGLIERIELKLNDPNIGTDEALAYRRMKVTLEQPLPTHGGGEIPNTSPGRFDDIEVDNKPIDRMSSGEKDDIIKELRKNPKFALFEQMINELPGLTPEEKNLMKISFSKYGNYSPSDIIEEAKKLRSAISDLKYQGAEKTLSLLGRIAKGIPSGVKYSTYAIGALALGFLAYKFGKPIYDRLNRAAEWMDKKLPGGSNNGGSNNGRSNDGRSNDGGSNNGGSNNGGSNSESKRKQDNPWIKPKF